MARINEAKHRITFVIVRKNTKQRKIQNKLENVESKLIFQTFTEVFGNNKKKNLFQQCCLQVRQKTERV